MADILDRNGLTLETYRDILAYVQNSLNEIYATDGDTINFDSETPDGQFTNILAQISADIRQLSAEIYNSFNPDNCQGALQDQRYALNYITRGAGTYTIQNIEIGVDRTVNLVGLDTNYDSSTASCFTVADDAGNQWYLIDSVTLTTGTHSLPFRSQNMGLVQPIIGTIQNQVTKVLGVTSVNNSVAPTSLGRNEESDVEFRIRRNRSTAVRGQNNYDTMTGQLLQIKDVLDARVFVNNTNNPDTSVTDIAGGVPARTIWVIVDGGGANDKIGEVIYQNSAGLPTFESPTCVSVDITTVSNQNYVVNFDRTASVDFYIRFDVKNISGIAITDDMKNDIREHIYNNLQISMGEPVETSEITNLASQALLAIDANMYALNVEVSIDGANWTDFIDSTSWQKKFRTYPDDTYIKINVV